MIALLFACWLYLPLHAAIGSAMAQPDQVVEVQP
jgi:hypothetical protein